MLLKLQETESHKISKQLGTNQYTRSSIAMAIYQTLEMQWHKQRRGGGPGDCGEGGCGSGGGGESSHLGRRCQQGLRWWGRRWWTAVAAKTVRESGGKVAATDRGFGGKAAPVVRY